MQRPKVVAIRLSKAEHERLAAAAAAAWTTPSALFRRLAFASLETSIETRATEPASSGCLTAIVSTRLTPSEAESLAQKATECDLPLAAYLRIMLRGTTPSAHRPVARAAVVALSRVGNNLNQLTRLAHSGTLIGPELLRTIDALRVEVYRVREEILAVRGDRP